MIAFEVVGVKELEHELKRAVVTFPDQLKRNVRKCLFIVRKRAKDHYLTGRRSKYTGLQAPQARIETQMLGGGRDANGRVYTKEKWAKYWELEEGQFSGGSHWRIIRPVKAKVLRFTVDGRVVFAKEVRQEGPRKFLEPALHDMEPQIERLIGDTFGELFQ